MEGINRRLLIICLIVSPFVVAGQVDLNKALWKNLPCDTGQTQTDMNICSGAKARMADSAMTMLYAKILIHLDAVLKEASKNQKPTEYDMEYAKSLKHRIDLLKKSQRDFESYKESMTGFISEQYAGGTIRPLMVNLWSLGLTEDRIKSLNSLIEVVGLR